MPGTDEDEDEDGDGGGDDECGGGGDGDGEDSLLLYFQNRCSRRATTTTTF